MARIHVNRGTTSFGIFSEEEVRAGLSSGRFARTDLGWREGMTTWLPLSQMPEFAVPGQPTGATPGVTSTVATSTAPAAAPRSGLPWDERQARGFFNAFIETLKLVLTNPTTAFTAMKREGGLSEPLIYAVAGGSFGLVVYFIYNLAFQALGVMGSRGNPLTHLMGAGIAWTLLLILSPLLIVIGVFINSAILHVCLMIVGGANQTFETTFRVVCFCSGSVSPLFLIPLCGGLVVGVWDIVIRCIGLARAHETDTGRAFLAVFLPIIVCCGGAVLLAIFFGGLGILSQSSH
jgi:hypothetical protein